MSAEGGINREWLRPMPEERYIEGVGREMGSHQGGSQALNIRNPKPGMHYYYWRRDKSSVQRAVNDGWRPVKVTDGVSPGADISTIDGEHIPELDGIMAFKDVILMEIPQEKYRAITERKAQAAKYLREGTADTFIAKGQNIAARVGATRDDLYYASKHHGET